jgi:hypothetical protein
MSTMSKTEMVRAYTESLLEKMLGVDKLQADADGDWPVRYQNALYYVRVDPGRSDEPVVQIFAVVLADVASSPELFEELNAINTRLRFARAFWVNDQVLIESEIVGEAMSMSGFANACDVVALAADHFGAHLAERFGGRALFSDGREPGDRPPSPAPGQYL